MKIKNKELLRTIKYALFMISAGVIQFVSSTVIKLIIDATTPEKSLFFIKEFILSTFVADTVGLLLSIIWNFTFNRKYTFKSCANVPLSMALALLFYVPFYPFQIWYVDMVEKQLNIGFWGYLIGLVTCMILNGVLEFLWQRFVIYRKTIDSATSNGAEGESNAESAENDAASDAQNDGVSGAENGAAGAAGAAADAADNAADNNTGNATAENSPQSE